MVSKKSPESGPPRTTNVNGNATVKFRIPNRDFTLSRWLWLMEVHACQFLEYIQMLTIECIVREINK